MEMAGLDATTLIGVAYGLFIVINAVDLWITRIILNHPGGKELNPVMRFIYRRFGLRGMAVLKIILILWLGFQHSVGGLDLFTIVYLNLVFVFVVSLMYKDLKNAGLTHKLFMLPTRNR